MNGDAIIICLVAFIIHAHTASQYTVEAASPDPHQVIAANESK